MTTKTCMLWLAAGLFLATATPAVAQTPPPAEPPPPTTQPYAPHPPPEPAWLQLPAASQTVFVAVLLPHEPRQGVFCAARLQAGEDGEQRRSDGEHQQP